MIKGSKNIKFLYYLILTGENTNQLYSPQVSFPFALHLLSQVRFEGYLLSPIHYLAQFDDSQVIMIFFIYNCDILYRCFRSHESYFL